MFYKVYVLHQLQLYKIPPCTPSTGMNCSEKAIMLYILFCFLSHKAVEDIGKTGCICILDVDMQGVKSIKKTTLSPRYIFVQPPSMGILVGHAILVL